VGGGVQSFPGLQPANALKKVVATWGFTRLLDYDMTELFNGRGLFF
jgi:iron complex outermembrane receptor protein